MHGDDITVGGQRTAVESLVKMQSKKDGIKKQVLETQTSRPPEDCQPGDEHMCGLLQHARRRTKLGGRARIDAQRSQADARGRMPVRVMTSPSVVNDRRWNFSSGRYRGTMRSRSK